jgi:hypothetical protein
MSAITLIPVTSASQLEEFIHVPWRIYPPSSCWIPPLKLELRLHLSPKNPYFAHARWQAWIAKRGRQPVGRISAQIDSLSSEHGRKTGFFGLLEAIDDEEVFAQLTAQAETWLKAQGMEAIQGPYNLSINHECGLLIEGFDRPPAVMMPYNLPYYATQLEKLNYRKAQDLLAYLLEAATPPPQAVLKFASKAAEIIKIRSLCPKTRAADFELLRTIFNDAWADNWGFVPFTPEEFNHLARTLRHLVPEDFVKIAEIEGEAVGMLVALPDLNELLLDLNGRLWPFNWLRLLWRLKAAPPHTARVILMGILRQYRLNLLGAAIAYALIDALREALLARGIQQVELSWVLEDNLRMRGVIENLGAKVYKRYRIYEKPLR